MRLLPSRRFFLVVETALVLGLLEGLLIKLVYDLPYTRAQKAMLLMAGIAGVFSIVLSIARPMIDATLKHLARSDEGKRLSRLIIHGCVMLLLFWGYMAVYF
jgi:hypothetical protein